jgi:hypothetical protein
MFPVDAFWYAHSARLRTARSATAESELTPDQQWLGQTPEQQAQEFVRTSCDRLRLAMEDLAQLPRRPSTLVEGPQVLPDMLPSGAAAVFLFATKEFQRSALERRPLPPTANPRVALENRIRKDQLYAELVASAAAERGFAVVLVDGSRPPAEILATVERSFASILDANRGPVDLQPARRWENEVVADNIGSWLASSDAPPDPPRAYPFSCECGRRRGCSSQVDLALEEFQAMPRVVAPGHAASGVGRTHEVGSARSG